jgi:hypothetical protein
MFLVTAFAFNKHSTTNFSTKYNISTSFYINIYKTYLENGGGAQYRS